MTPENRRPTPTIEFKVDLKSNPDLVKTLGEAKTSNGEKELTAEKRYRVVRNFYLDKLNYCQKTNMFGGEDPFLFRKNEKTGKEECMLGADDKPIKFKLTFKTPQLTAEGVSTLQGGPSLLKFLKEEFDKRERLENKAEGEKLVGSAGGTDAATVEKSKKKGLWERIVNKFKLTPEEKEQVEQMQLEKQTRDAEKKLRREAERVAKEQAKGEAEAARKARITELKTKLTVRKQEKLAEKAAKERAKQEVKAAKEKARLEAEATKKAKQEARRVETQARIEAVRLIVGVKELFIDGKFDEAEHLLIKYGRPPPEEMRKYFPSWSKKYVGKNLNRNSKGIEEEIQKEIEEKKLKGLEAERARYGKYEDVLTDLFGTNADSLSKNFSSEYARLINSKIYKSAYPAGGLIMVMPEDELKKQKKVRGDLEKYLNKLLKREVKLKLRNKLEIEFAKEAVKKIDFYFGPSPKPRNT